MQIKKRLLLFGLSLSLAGLTGCGPTNRSVDATTQEGQTNQLIKSDNINWEQNFQELDKYINQQPIFKSLHQVSQQVDDEMMQIQLQIQLAENIDETKLKRIILDITNELSDVNMKTVSFKSEIEGLNPYGDLFDHFDLVVKVSHLDNPSESDQWIINQMIFKKSRPELIIRK